MQLAKMQQWMKPRRQRQEEMMRKDKHFLLQEIRKAHEEWQAAERRLDYAIEVDEIDYAIYALEAAEKRYEMLMKAAKRSKLNLLDSDFAEEADL